MFVGNRAHKQWWKIIKHWTKKQSNIKKLKYQEIEREREKHVEIKREDTNLQYSFSFCFQCWMQVCHLNCERFCFCCCCWSNAKTYKTRKANEKDQRQKIQVEQTQTSQRKREQKRVRRRRKSHRCLSVINAITHSLTLVDLCVLCCAKSVTLACLLGLAERADITCEQHNNITKIKTKQKTKHDIKIRLKEEKNEMKRDDEDDRAGGVMDDMWWLCDDNN